MEKSWVKKSAAFAAAWIVLLGAACDFFSSDDGGEDNGGNETETKDEIFTVTGSEAVEAFEFEHDDSRDFNATFLIIDKTLDAGTQVRLAKSTAPVTNDSAGQPHFVSKLFSIQVAPSQDFNGQFLLMVADAYTAGSGEPLGMYYWKPFRGTINLINAPDGMSASDVKGYWEYFPDSTIVEGRSIDDASHMTEGVDINRFMYEEEGKKTGLFAVADPGPQNSSPDEPWRKWLKDNGKDAWLNQPASPDPDYEYAGMTVVHNKLGVYTTLSQAQLEAPFSSTDLDLIHTNTRVDNQVTDNDIIVSHHYRPKSQD